MGFLFKSKTKKVEQPYESNPWEPQQPYLLGGFDQAQTALKDGLASLNGISDFTADLTPQQRQAIGLMSGIGSNTAQTLGSTALSTGMSQMGNFAQFGNNAQSLYNQAGVDPTQSIISNAHAYANDPYLQGQIDSALGDVRKAFDRNVADINGNATATGNINSTRAGALEAIAMDDAMDRGAAISSQMRGQAYQAGLDRAMATNDAMFDRRMAANGMIGMSGLQGFDMARGGLDTSLTGANASLTAESIIQGQNQAEIDGQIAGASMPLDFVSRYMSAIGGNYGSNGFTTGVKTTPSPFQQITGAITTAAGAGMKWPF